MIVLAYLWPLALVPLLARKTGRRGAMACQARHRADGRGALLLFGYVVFTSVVSLATLGLGCVLSLLLVFGWIGILALHVVAILKGINGTRLHHPGSQRLREPFLARGCCDRLRCALVLECAAARARRDSRLSARAGAARGARRAPLPLHADVQPLCGNRHRARRLRARRMDYAHANESRAADRGLRPARWIALMYHALTSGAHIAISRRTASCPVSLSSTQSA